MGLGLWDLAQGFRFSLRFEVLGFGLGFGADGFGIWLWVLGFGLGLRVLGFCFMFWCLLGALGFGSEFGFKVLGFGLGFGT